MSTNGSQPTAEDGDPIPLVPGAGWALLRSVMARQRRRFGAVLLIVGVSALTTAVVPTLIQRAIDDGALGGDRDALRTVVLWFGVVTAVGAVVHGLRIWLVTLIGQHALHDIRERAGTALESLPVGRFERLRRGDLVARMTGDVERLENALSDGVPFILGAMVATVAGAVGMAIVSPTLTLIGLVVVVPLLAATRWLSARSSTVYPRARRVNGAMVAELAETIEGAQEIRAYGRARQRRVRFGGVNRAAGEASLDGMRMRVRFYSAITMFQAVATALVVIVGGVLAIDGQESVGVVAAAIIALTRIYDPLVELITYWDTIQSTRASLDRVASVVALHDERPPGHVGAVETVGGPGDDGRGGVDLTGVGFAYVAGRPVVEGLDLYLAPGTTTALVGATGAGKSTIARIVSGLARPDVGSCRIDGQVVADLAPAERRRLVVAVLQEGFCIDASVADNVRLALPTATDAMVADALEATGGDWWRRLPDGMATPAGTGGANLSAGQRQLIALARIALIDPLVILLDEATSLLDPETEATVAEALERLFSGRTVLIIAHRRATAARCARVVHLDGGRVVADGPPSEVLGGVDAS
ncbi:MAG: ABC transporter ATP-binding protein [Acidimicrobiales bacterium]